VGNLAGDTDAVLSEEERARVLGFQAEISGRDDLPILSSFLYLESAEAFGCGAGLTHLYIDGSGEVSPCNLVPLSFGNVADEPLEAILERMGRYFEKPRTSCVGQALSRFIPEGTAPAPPDVSEDICQKHLPADHDVPAFFRIRDTAAGSVGRDELMDAYDHISGSYDDYWVVEAGKPVKQLVADLQVGAYERVLEAGCGTGYGTEQLLRKLGSAARYLAVDISDNMLGRARERLGRAGARNVEFIHGDALDILRREGPFDLVFSSWVLGYIPTEEFIHAAGGILRPGGRLAFIVHRENSPARELGIFAELVAEDPSALTRQVGFDFPRDGAHVGGMVRSSGLSVEQLREGSVVFSYRTPREAFDHLLKSGAGTAFYEAVAPEKRAKLTGRFIAALAERNGGADRFDVIHDYIACIAVREA
ncbi:MAG: methyltransferase domain-containing protein, partial [Candidatus Latescibacteria bacterium]|nr:methyltransferase domain-containing protein [Candidatus Latescibacterota bacterium]